MKTVTTTILFFLFLGLAAQEKPELTVQKIMQDPKSWVGTSPNSVYWSEDGKTVFFNWNPEQNPADSLYSLTAPWKQPQKVPLKTKNILPSRSGSYNKDRSKKTYVKSGDVFLYDVRSGSERRITNTVANESSPSFTFDEKGVTYISEGNLYEWDIASGTTIQHTDFIRGKKREEKKPGDQDEWLSRDELSLIGVLREEKEKKEKSEEHNKLTTPKRPLSIYTDKASIRYIQLSPDRKHIIYSLYERADNKNTIVPDYVTESGYTEDISARSNVGGAYSNLQTGIYDIANEKHYLVADDDLPGLEALPDFAKDYPDKERDKNNKRPVFTHFPIWSDDGKNAIVSFRSKDNKDRWIALLDINNGKVKTLNRQRDEAWIAGPGIGWSFSSGDMGWLPDNETIWFQSEETGYSHLYSLNIKSGKKKALTSGKFEIYGPRISKDKKSWYFEANMEDSGIRKVYQMSLKGGKISALTDLPGKSVPFFSPDESKIALLNSVPNRPDELFIQDNQIGSAPQRVTFSQTKEWSEYPWRVPEFVDFKARDGAMVKARLYKPEESVKTGAAVVFVHGAGYLQNAHQWWSSYFREYMFHNLLADKGYTVLDIDYRGSAGYGRDWRTGIYRHMGGFDLTDQVDGVKYLVEDHGIDEKRIGIYGGSYGGFITLMAMFTQPDVFASGAALRSVTDWAHYNHGYTSNILNTPVEDSLAFRKSSPIYYAEGLKGRLLILHGMVDTNVHFQDVVRLAQRLIELGKENWEFAVYPKEGHGFVHPTSWTDEYRRILKLFEETLKNSEQ